MFEWISENPQGATLLATVFIAVATAIYAVLTGLLVRETIKMRRAQTEPKLAAYFEPNEKAVIFGHLYIENIGLGPAYDISFELIPEGNRAGAEFLIEDFKTAKFLERGVNYLGPGQRLRAGFTQMNEHYEQKIEAVIRLRMQYRGSTGWIRRPEECLIDFSELEGYTRIGTPPLYAISSSLENLQKDVERVVNGMRRLKVDQFDKADREQERADWEEARRARSGQPPRDAGE